MRLLTAFDCESNPNFRKRPFLYFHGTGDDIVPFGGRSYMGFPPAVDYVAELARRNCGASPPSKTSFERSTVQCNTTCDDSMNVTFCRIEGTGHSWPGSKNACPSFGPFKCNHDVDATGEAFRFFERITGEDVAVSEDEEEEEKEDDDAWLPMPDGKLCEFLFFF